MRKPFLIKLLMLFILCVLIYPIGCGMRYDREIESNDDQRTAMKIQSSKPIKGTIEGEKDIDFYKLAEQQKSFKAWDDVSARNSDIAVRILVTGTPDLDLLIKIHSENRVVKVIDDNDLMSNGNHYGEEIANVFFSINDIREGKALFSVEKVPNSRSISGNSNNEYTLTVYLREMEDSEEREPNDKPVLATRFGQSSLMRGFFDPARNPLATDEEKKEVDWFAFTIQDTTSQEIIHLSLSAVPDVDSIISLYDELGYLIRMANSNNIGEMERLMSVGLGKGNYYIKVESSDLPQKNTKVGYILKKEKQEGILGEIEPNDRYTFANTITFSKDISGYFNPAGDIDWYRMNIYEPEPQVISIKVSPTESIDPVIELYTSREDLLLMVNDRGTDEGEILKNIGVSTGIYYAKIYNLENKRYDQGVQYTLLVEKRKWEEDEEFEINDSFERANPLVMSGLKRGYITPKGDRDLYSLQVGKETSTTEGTVAVNFELTPCILLDLAMNIWDESGNLIALINENPAEEGESEILDLPKGNYFIEIMSMNKYENSRDSYILRVYESQ